MNVYGRNRTLIIAVEVVVCIWGLATAGPLLKFFVQTVIDII
jgi:hypothetical protein